MTMGMSIDEAGHDQAITCIVPGSVSAIYCTRRADRNDPAVLDQQVLLIGHA